MVINTIKAGFEVECIIKNQKVYDFKKIIGKYHLAQIGYDPSIREHWDTQTFELRTKPTTLKRSFKRLKKILEAVKEYGFTDSSCGLHFNFSTRSNKEARLFNPLRFCANPIWMRLLHKYRRSRNEYCNHYVADAKTVYRTISDLEGHYDDHHASVSLFNFHGKANQRIEIRVFGNKNYHKKYQKIKKDCNAIINLFKKCKGV